MSCTSLPRYALYGGAFDPPHIAHVDMVRQLVVQCGIERVWVVPTGQAWHKSRPLTDAVHRMAMTRLAFANVPQVVVDDREILRQGPSFTVETLAELQAAQPPAEWFLLMGQDQWAKFTTWHKWQQICTIASVVVAERPMNNCGEWQKNMELLLGACTDAALAPPRVTRLEWKPMPVSSTSARENPSEAPALLPEAVASYISEHFLYTSPT